MKKFTIIFITAIIAGMSCVFASEYTKFSRRFINHFKDCDAYEETITSNFEDTTFTTHRKISGWKNGLCRYTEVITSNEGSYKLNCRFAEIQLDDLYLAMKDRSNKPEKYNLDIFQQKVDPKTGETIYVTNGSTVIKGNKAYIVWAKYQNNPYFCRYEKLK
jgi:hypothetical protein